MNPIQVYRYGGCDVRTVNRGGEPWFVSADVYDAYAEALLSAVSDRD